MRKTTRKLVCSLLAATTLALTAVFGSMTANAEMVTGKYGDWDGDGLVTAADASNALEYVREMDPTNIVAMTAVTLGMKNVTAVNASMIYAKSLNDDYKFPGGETFTVEVTTETTTEDTSDLPAAKVFVLGDSTGASFNDAKYYYPRVGFGVPLDDYFNDKIEVVNLALSGRSSKSYVEDPEYTQYLNGISEGDYVLIAFGHNDEKTEAARYTDPNGDKTVEGSFQKSLYDNYVKPALDKKATPILCTPIVRRTASGDWSNSQLHITADATADGVTYKGGDYGKAIKDLGASEGLTVIDNTTLTKELYDELTPAQSIYLHAWTSYKDSSVDNTHLNNYGANYVDYVMTKALKESGNPLGMYVKSDIKAPEKDATINLNPDYVMPDESDVTGDDLISKLWTTTAPFYGSVFGDMGGDEKFTNGSYSISDEFTSEGGLKVNIRAGALDAEGKVSTSVGKISGATDGIAFYYIPIDANDDFSLRGTVTVNSCGVHNQISWGAAIFDRILVDTYQAEGYSYVSAGILGNNEKRSITYARVDGTLQGGTEKLSAPVEAGTVVNVSIVKNGDKFTATYGDVTEEYTLDMTGTAYAGFYAARSADITITNISYNNEVVK